MKERKRGQHGPRISALGLGCHRTRNGGLVGLALAVAFSSQAREIQFGGYTWTVRTGHGGPGPNAWDENNVWLESGLEVEVILRAFQFTPE